MRRALGLGNSTPVRAQADHSISSGGNTHRRHFVRDGEVPVTVIHHDDPSGANKLETARQALREQIAVREQIERQLAEAQATIQTLETQLGHERIAKAEALRRAEDQRLEVEQQLEEERTARQQAAQDRDTAIARRREAEDGFGSLWPPRWSWSRPSAARSIIFVWSRHRYCRRARGRCRSGWRPRA